MLKPTGADFARARAARAERMKGPLAKGASYDADRNRIVITLRTGVEVAFVPQQIQGLGDATADELRDVEIGGKGLSIHWPKLDADFSVQNLLHGFTGTQRWMAAQLGASGPRASREIGKRGGRSATNA